MGAAPHTHHHSLLSLLSIQLVGKFETEFWGSLTRLEAYPLLTIHVTLLAFAFAPGFSTLPGTPWEGVAIVWGRISLGPWFPRDVLSRRTLDDAQYSRNLSEELSLVGQ